MSCGGASSFVIYVGWSLTLVDGSPDGSRFLKLHSSNTVDRLTGKNPWRDPVAVPKPGKGLGGRRAYAPVYAKSAERQRPGVAQTVIRPGCSPGRRPRGREELAFSSGDPAEAPSVTRKTFPRRRRPG